MLGDGKRPRSRNVSDPGTASRRGHRSATASESVVTYDELLMVLFKTNHKCIRLGRWHQSIFELVEQPRFPTLSWEQVKDEFKRLPLTKYCNYNLINIIHDIQEKPTFEVRILPSTLDPFEITCAASVIETLLFMARSSMRYSQTLPIPTNKENIHQFLDTINISKNIRHST